MQRHAATDMLRSQRTQARPPKNSQVERLMLEPTFAVSETRIHALL